MKVNYRKYDNRYIKNHPKFGTRVVGFHRVKIYEKYGEDLPDCEICGKPVVWDGCHIDHIDNDPMNNNIENLRPLHHGCNTGRQKVKPESKHEKGTLPNIVMNMGFLGVYQAAQYLGIDRKKLSLVYRQNPEEGMILLNKAKVEMDNDPNAKRQTAKQRYDAAMYEMGCVRIQGWVRPENRQAVQELLETKAGLDYESGEHLIKKGEKRAEKPK